MYDLRLFTPITTTNVFVDDITAIADGYQHVTRYDAGYWRASFELTNSEPVLFDWFNNYLGFHLEEHSGGEKSWEGLLYEMELTWGNISRIRSLDYPKNYVTVRYKDRDTEAVLDTSPASEATSIARYGRLEEIYSIPPIDSTGADNMAATLLKRHAWPIIQPMAGGLDYGQPRLRCTFHGYIWTANYRHVGLPSLDDAEGNLSTFIETIVNNDCEFLSTGIIKENTTQIRRSLDQPARCYDQMKFLASLGDSSGNQYAVQVYNDRYLEYVQISNTPRYFLVNNRLQTTVAGGYEVNPWTVKPAVVRDQEYPVSGAEQGSWFADRRDFMLEEVTVGANSGLTWRAIEFDEADTLIALSEAQYTQSEQERNDTSSATSSTSGGSSRAENLNWKRRLGYKPGSPEWKRAQSMSWQERQDAIRKAKSAGNYLTRKGHKTAKKNKLR